MALQGMHENTLPSNPVESAAPPALTEQQIGESGGQSSGKSTAVNPTDSSENRPRLVLGAIHYRPPRSGALINGRTVYEGDKIDGAAVLRIERDTVRVLEDKNERVLKLR